MSISRYGRKQSNLFLPVTGLHTIKCAGTDILLAGCGGILEAINLSTCSKLCDSGPFLTQTIRRIIPLAPIDVSESCIQHEILVQGGSHLAWVKLRVELCGMSITDAYFEIIHKYDSPYLMISGRPSPYPGIAAIFLTSHNALLHVKLNTLSQTLDVSHINDDLTTFLYSGDFAAVDKDRYLVASGTAFGQVLVWSCVYDEQQGQWLANPCREFKGHQGSIFGVSISNPLQIDGKTRRIMISCSDDRTIRVWDVSDALTNGRRRFDNLDLSTPIKETIFDTSESTLTQIWAHASRIWNVDILSDAISSETYGNALVVSTGEDATAQSWFLELNSLWQHTKSRNQALHNRFMDNHHDGKNIWSRCYKKENGKITFWTGAADGQIVVRSYGNDGYASQPGVQSSQAFKQISTSLTDSMALSSSKRDAMFLKSYMILDSNQILGTTDSGVLLQGFLDGGVFNWQVLDRCKQSMAFVLCAQRIAYLAFLVDNYQHSLLMYDSTTLAISELCSVRNEKVARVEIAWSGNTKATENMCICLSVCYFGKVGLDLVWIELEDSNCRFTSKSAVQLPPKFEVTSTCYDPDTQILLFGSREGTIVTYNALSPSTYSASQASAELYVHGSDTVTSIQKLSEGSSKSESNSFYLTTGRDGSYCVIQILPSSLGSIKIIHRASPVIGPNIEGSHIVRLSDGTQKILLYGFHSTNFVVWDETDQTQIMSVNCGGAHRSWVFSLDKKTGEGGIFVWTKAGVLMHHQQASPNHKIVRHGGHGREIKALAVSFSDPAKILMATGSEDTNIRLFESNHGRTADEAVRCLAVLRKHTTGLQDLKFSRTGEYLFSAAGMEELYAWRLTAVPVFKQGVCFAGALPRHSQSDARIMSIDIGNVTNSDRGITHVLIAAFSNGQFKVIEYLGSFDNDMTGTFAILSEISFGSICLTQAHFLDPFSENDHTAIIAGTNGIVNVFKANNTIIHNNDPKLQHAVLAKHKVHQNSITALQTVRLASSVQLLFSGGDDNALGITLCRISADTSPMTGLQTLIIPKAHAAALTAIAVFELEKFHKSGFHQRDKVIIVTAGNDQRVKVWMSDIDLQLCEEASLSGTRNNSPMEYIGVDLLEDTHTNVADISEIKLLQSKPWATALGNDNSEDERGGLSANCQRVEVLVVGVGMEIVKFNIPFKARI